MNAKTKLILSSCMSIAVASFLIAGSTWAAFTSESKTNIAVNAGKLNVVATAELVDAWSAVWNGSGYDRTHDYEMRKFDTKNGVGYTFSNGGTVVYSKSNDFHLNNITCGDGAKVRLSIKNYSNVKIQYRVEISVSDDDGLLDGLNVTYSFGGQEYAFPGAETNRVYTEWMTDIPRDPQAGASLGTFEVSIELPWTETNEFQHRQCTIAINVFAMQYNAHIED